MSPRPARDQAALRSTPSKRKPAVRATFCEAVLPVTVRSVMRAKPSSVSAQRATARAASAAYPRPRAHGAVQ